MDILVSFGGMNLNLYIVSVKPELIMGRNGPITD